MFLKLSELLEWRALAQVPHELAGRSATPCSHFLHRMPQQQLLWVKNSTIGMFAPVICPLERYVYDLAALLCAHTGWGQPNLICLYTVNVERAKALNIPYLKQ